MDEAKKIELNILLKFDEFCRDHKLRYTLCAGTLLGAIRHKGFIPWDDDIDLMMARPDYEKFLALVRKDDSFFKNLDYFVEDGSDPKSAYRFPFIKIYDLHTQVKSLYVDRYTSLWIDVFPVDGLPEDWEEVKEIYRKGDQYRKILGLTFARLGAGKTKLHMLSKYILKPLARLYGADRCIRKLNELGLKYPYEKCRYVGMVTFGIFGPGERFEKEGFEKPIEVDFEGHKLPAFASWDAYLTGKYGDYMILPPEKDRKIHFQDVYLKV